MLKRDAHMGILSSLVSLGSKMDLLDSNLTGAKAAALFFNKDEDRDFHSIPVGKKLCFHCRGAWVQTLVQNEDPTCRAMRGKNIRVRINLTYLKK